MLGSALSVFGGVMQVARMLHLDEVADSLQGKNEITRDEFRSLVEEIAENLAEAENSAEEVNDAKSYFAQKNETVETLEPILFRQLDANSNGKLEGEEVEKLKDFLDWFNREALIASDPENDTPADPLKILENAVA